tara:strand:- start:727 stop:1644 length:918 start_codon:yes stop_codon:yes gene_type:complete
MNDIIDAYNIKSIINNLKNNYFIFVLVSIVILLIPFILYYNDEPKYTVTIIVEPQTSMNSSIIQRDWETAHRLASLKLPFIGNEKQKDTSLTNILLSDFFSILTSPTKFNQIYLEYKNRNEFNTSFKDTYENFNVIFDSRSFSNKKNILLVSFTSDTEYLAEKFLLDIMNRSYSELKETFIYNFKELVIIGEEYMDVSYSEEDLQEINIKNNKINGEVFINFDKVIVALNALRNKKIQIEALKENMKNNFGSNMNEFLIFSSDTKIVEVKKLNIVNQFVIFFILLIFINYILYIFLNYIIRSSKN